MECTCPIYTLMSVGCVCGSLEENGYESSAEVKLFTYDFNSVLGDTLKEKTENLCVFLYNKLNGDKDKAFIIGNPELVCIFETSCSGYNPGIQKCNHLIDCGQHGVFKVYKTDNVPKNLMYVFGKDDIFVVRVIGV